MSALVEALRRVLDDPSVTVYDYAEAADFERLWRAVSEKTAGPPTQVLLICWGRTAADPEVAPVVTGRHLTPLDWAACAAALYQQITVYVIDVSPDRHTSCPAVRLYRHLDHARIPWVRLVELSDVLAESRGELKALFSPRPYEGSFVSARDFLELRKGALLDPDPSGDRHAIANLVGPLRLLGRRPSQMGGHKRALWCLLAAAGLLASGDSEADTEDLSRLMDASLGTGPTRFVLVDDQWHHGWAEWLCSLLTLAWNEMTAGQLRAASHEGLACVAGDPVEGRSLWVASDPSFLLRSLREALQAASEVTDRETRDARFRLRVSPGLPENGVELLLLDLRLFQPGSDAEKAFVRSVVPIARGVGTDDGSAVKRSQLAWRSLDGSELDRLANWDDDTTTPSRASVLTLLPRVLGLADMSLPVIVFSSTGRRDVVAMLQGYDNVITCFAKPRFFGEGSEVLGHASATLGQAFREAAPLLFGRRQLGEQKGVGPGPSSVRAAGGVYGHAVLCVDEAGAVSEPWFTVGGLLALFADVESERRFATSLQDAGVHWGPRGLHKSTSTPIDEKVRVLERVREVAKVQGVDLRAVALGVRDSERGSLSGRSTWPEAHLDYLHRALVRMAAEVSLLHVIRAGEMQKRWTFSLLADVRSRPPEGLDASVLARFGLRPQALESGARMWKAADDLIEWLRSRQDEISPFCSEILIAYRRRHERESKNARDTIKVPFLDPSSVFPILDDLLRECRDIDCLRGLQVEEAQACYLPEGRDSAMRWPNRQLHFLADWVVGEMRAVFRGDRAMAGWAGELVGRGGLIEEVDDQTTKYLALARAAYRGDGEEATAQLLAAGTGTRSELKDRCAGVVLDLLAKTSGEDFGRGCRRAFEVSQKPGSSKGERSEIDVSGRSESEIPVRLTAPSSPLDETRQGPMTLWIGLGRKAITSEEISEALSPRPLRVHVRRGRKASWFAFADYDTLEAAGRAQRTYVGPWTIEVAQRR